MSFGYLSGRQVNHHRIRVLLVGDYFPAVSLEEKIHHYKCNPFVPINEWMVSAKMKTVSSRLVEQGLVNELLTNGYPGLSRSRFEESQIPQCGPSYISLEEVGVDYHD